MDNLNSLIFTDKVLNLLEEFKYKNNNNQIIDNISEINSSEDLFPIRRGLRKAVNEYFSEIPQFSDIKWYLAAYWDINRKVKNNIWIFAAKNNKKTNGKLQINISLNGKVYSEYVAYKILDQEDVYHIQRLSKWLKEPNYFKEFLKGIKSLPYGFRLYCVCNNGELIDNFVHEIDDIKWMALKETGLRVSEYFTLAREYDREDLLDLNIDQVAKLLVSDLSELSGLYPLLQGESDVVKVPNILEVDYFLKQIRNASTESQLNKKTDVELILIRRAFNSDEYEGQSKSNNYYSRDVNVAAVAKMFASGVCDLCENEAPFSMKNGEPYLETHHVKPRANGGEDKIYNVVALCPNCHRKIHHLKLAHDIKKLENIAKKRYLKCQNMLNKNT